jgi:hypothetical protein
MKKTKQNPAFLKVYPIFSHNFNLIVRNQSTMKGISFLSFTEREPDAYNATAGNIKTRKIFQIIFNKMIFSFEKISN